MSALDVARAHPDVVLSRYGSTPVLRPRCGCVVEPALRALAAHRHSCQWFVSASPSTVSRAPVTAPVGTALSRALSSAVVRVMSAAPTFSSR